MVNGGNSMIYIYVGIGGFLGASLRYIVSVLFYSQGGAFPFATLFSNWFGSFLLAYLTFYLFEQVTLSKQMRTALTTGLLGSFTTFSAFSIEVVELLEANLMFMGMTYVVFSIVGGFAMAYIGFHFRKKGVRK